MTNDEAIYVLRNTAFLGWSEQAEKVSEAVQMAVEALKAQLTEKDTTSDCISRRGAIDHFKSIAVATSIGNKYNEGFVDGLNFAVGHLKTMPSVQPDIIHCEDCKHSEHWYRDKSRCFLWHEEGIDVFEDGFCSYAERRTDGSD